MYLSKFYEFVQSDFEAIESFHLKDDLCRDVYDSGDKMFSDIREKLLTIADDFYKSTDLDAEIKDIVLTGSLANYNWSQRYSDFDLHIVINYDDINADPILVENYIDYAKKLWGFKNNIIIKGFDVEVYIENESTPSKSSGLYSILNDQWLKFPKKIDFVVDEENIRLKAESVMSVIDDLDTEFDSMKPGEIKIHIDKVWEKIKRFRKSGLESEGGEFSTGNLTFKLLRRNGYIGKVIELKTKLYEKQFED